jgi:SAM-dependent methyltransferase
MMVKNFLKNFIESQNFHPSLLGVFVNPFFISRRGLYRGIKKNSKWLEGKLLDVGCGSKPYLNLFEVSDYIGLEYDSKHSRLYSQADFFYNGNRFPFDDQSFDSVLCNQVLEHVFNPDFFLSEINRVLKPGGRVLLTVPFVWDEHEQPNDFARYSSFGLTALFTNNNFSTFKIEKINSNISVLFQLLNAYFYKVLPQSNIVKMIFCLLIMAPISITGSLLGIILPQNEDLFLDQVILAEKK